jgi:hypothetical protein
LMRRMSCGLTGPVTGPRAVTFVHASACRPVLRTSA